jgi:hypothetical protein
MDTETLIVLGLGPFYAAAVACTYWGISYGWHMLRRIDQSATETQTTETTSPPQQVTTTPALPK